METKSNPVPVETCLRRNVIVVMDGLFGHLVAMVRAPSSLCLPALRCTQYAAKQRPWTSTTAIIFLERFLVISEVNGSLGMELRTP